MKLSQNFVKTAKQVGHEEVAKNAQLLIRWGFLDKWMAWIYSYLPMWIRVISKIKNIVNDEMLNLWSQEILMSSIQNKEIWEKTDRWSDENVDIWFKSKLKNWADIGLAWSHEEPITQMVKSHISSYKDLPVYVHQFQNKMRNEIRAKSWIMRCREFIMKDMYSYSEDENQHMEFYNKVIDVYNKIYSKLWIWDITYVTSASGWVFTDKFSHEFQTICDAWEDNIYVHNDWKIALNEEIFDDETLLKMWFKKEEFTKQKTAEVWNIFTFGVGKCEELDLFFIDQNSNKKWVYLWSYGIWISRLMGVIVEIFSDEKGIVWPENIAPYKYVIIPIWNKWISKSEEIYDSMLKKWIEVVLDDRKESPWFKLKDADLIGYPYQIVVSDKTMENSENVVELIKRSSGEKLLLDWTTIN